MDTDLPRVLVLAGGPSAEHEISLISAKSVYDALKTGGHDAVLSIISKSGGFLTAAESLAAIGQKTVASGGRSLWHALEYFKEFDVVFPVIHGPYGEDGRLQGLLDYARIAYVGSGTTASAACMDKGITRAILTAHGFTSPPYELIAKSEYLIEKEAVHRDLATLPLPLFVKPANLGSSLGITKVTHIDQLENAMRQAFAFDDRVVVEKAIFSARELEIAVFGNMEISASSIGEITYQADFYDYDTKYTPNKAQLLIPAPISQALSNRLTALALRAYRLFNCRGCARVDFFFSEAEDTLYLNEINTMPGFTPLSMYAKLWEHKGVSYQDLCAKLVQFGRQAFLTP